MPNPLTGRISTREGVARQAGGSPIHPVEEMHDAAAQIARANEARQL